MPTKAKRIYRKPIETAFARAEREKRQTRAAELDELAGRRDSFRAKNGYYHQQIGKLARFFIPEGAKVLEVGCSTGDLLASLKPSRGVGVDLSKKHVEIARQKHPDLEFHVGDAEALDLEEEFDFVVLSDVIGYLDDVWAGLRSLRKVMGPRSRLFVTYHNFLWEPVLQLGAALGLKMPESEQNWLGRADIENLLKLAGFEVVHSGSSTLLPVDLPVVSRLANRLLAQLPMLEHLALNEYFVARPVWQNVERSEPLTCSVVVPCRNEKGNVEDIFARTPELGAGTELIFVDGNSEDGTVEEIEKRLPDRPNTVLIHQGDGKGKGDAVRKGFAAAKGDILFILDADLTVPPEDLPKFYEAIAEGRGEFVNGTRLVYPMENGAMRLLNMFGNKFFSLAFTHLLGMPVKDTLCGTKVLRRVDYERIAANRAYFGDFDPFGDFDLLFGAARSAFKLVEVPVRYRARTYGDTKIDRFRHGWLLLKMTGVAFRKFRLGF
ncbi:MAG TPA: bifunctional class I SAM-dependent methyltransferase/glycosyltransferase family 2 protein [Myxococcales bacterium]|jgi:SAM-dependent methyltransferase